MHSVKKGNLFILLFLLYFLLTSIVMSLALDMVGITNSVIITGFAQFFGIFIPSLLYIYYTKESIKKVFHLRAPGVLNIVLSLLFAFCIFPMIWLLNLITQLFFTQPINDMINASIGLPYLVSVLIVAVFPGIFEELVTRGIFVYNYGNKSIWVTSIMSGLVFGMIHMNINQFSYAFVLGFFFSIIVHITGSIFTSIAMHFTINFINISMLYVSQSEFFQSLNDSIGTTEAMSDISTREVIIQSLPGFLGLLLFSLPLLYVLWRGLVAVNGKKALVRSNAPAYMFFEINPDDELPDDRIYELVNDAKSKLAKTKEKVITLPFIFFTIIFLILALLQEM